MSESPAQKSTDRIRVGIVGATVTPGNSGWGAGAHVPALRALPGFELEAVCTAHDATARASKEAFGAALAYADFDEMIANPNIDLVVVCVRVPRHRELVLAAVAAGKDVLCEWPLGASLAEAEEMTAAARDRSVRTAVGLQGRSDPVVMQARQLVTDGFVGEVLSVDLNVISQAQVVRGEGRIWQGERAAGANPLTIVSGHAIDTMCSVVGTITELSANVSTKVTEWTHSETGAPFAVDAPDNITVIGQLAAGADVSIRVSVLPSVPPDLRGMRVSIYGRDGALVISGSDGARILSGGRGDEPLEPIPVPAQYELVPDDTPRGVPYNVAQAYARLESSFRGGEAFDPDFTDAVAHHRLIEGIDRSAREQVAITL